jgi:hypothetical protein
VSGGESGFSSEYGNSSTGVTIERFAPRHSTAVCASVQECPPSTSTNLSSAMKVLAVAIALLASAALTAEPRAQASMSRCLMVDLLIRLAGEVSPTTGAHPIALRIVNRGQACQVSGYPGVVLRDGGGVIPFVYRHRGDIMVTSRPPRPVLLRTGGSAYLLLDKFRCDLGDRRRSTSVQIWLKGSTSGSRRVALGDMRISLCKPGIPAEGRVVNVSPFEPTLRATLHG